MAERFLGMPLEKARVDAWHLVRTLRYHLRGPTKMLGSGRFMVLCHKPSPLTNRGGLTSIGDLGMGFIVGWIHLGNRRLWDQGRTPCRQSLPDPDTSIFGWCYGCFEVHYQIFIPYVLFHIPQLAIRSFNASSSILYWLHTSYIVSWWLLMHSYTLL